jgi:hypothetical protein
LEKTIMPKGPQGQKRPADTAAAAIMVAKIATGEIEETRPSSKKTRSGEAGAKARNANLSSERRSEIAKKVSCFEPLSEPYSFTSWAKST